MDRLDQRYQDYIAILKEELVPAMGCTEPIAIAYAAAKAREVLGELPKQVSIIVSGNIIKNVKSVVVPNTDGMRGIDTAAVAGIIAGNSEKELEVISAVSQKQITEMKNYREKTEIRVSVSESPYIFDIFIEEKTEKHQASVRIVDYHTNIVCIQKDYKTIFEKEFSAKSTDSLTDRSVLSVEGIIDFADTVDIQDIREILDRQIEYNMAIAEEGLRGNYGANVGRVLLKEYGDNIKTRAKAKAAAGSDARMNGCELPVVINSGSGNQGITASVPVIEYARELKASDEMLYRALAVSNLITIHLKTGIGRLSAFCGAVSAGCGSGTGIAYLYGGQYKEISHTLVNAAAIVSGIVCDGAKASCAAKIASAVDAGILGYYMYINGQQFRGGDGLVTKGVENTIANISRLGHEGMRETDKEIIKIMVGE